jgi:hypothetical protein
LYEIVFNCMVVSLRLEIYGRHLHSLLKPILGEEIPMSHIREHSTSVVERGGGKAVLCTFQPSTGASIADKGCH